jgi:hypothetical protein
MVVVSLTSWLKRIHNVKVVVESIMNNTIQPDRVYLNLSKAEFDGVDLPKDLVDYFNSDDRLIINWVSGPNTKAMKKIFPILDYLQDDDIIIDADDDFLFPVDLIESRLKDFKNNGERYCISSNPHYSIGFKHKMMVVSAMSLFQKKMFGHWKRFVTTEIYNTNNDDRTYLTLMWLNGYLNKGCSKWSIHELLESKYNLELDNSLSSTKTIKGGRIYDRIAQKEFNKISDKQIIDSFNFWK